MNYTDIWKEISHTAHAISILVIEWGTIPLLYVLKSCNHVAVHQSEHVTCLRHKLDWQKWSTKAIWHQTPSVNAVLDSQSDAVLSRAGFRHRDLRSLPSNFTQLRMTAVKLVLACHTTVDVSPSDFHRTMNIERFKRSWIKNQTQ